MSIETLEEEVQSVVLARWVGILRTTTCICKFWKSQPTMFPLRAKKTWSFIFQNYSKNKSCLVGKMQLLAPEKMLIQRSTIHIHKFWQFRDNKFPRKDERRRYGKWIILYKSTIVCSDLDGKNLDRCFEGSRVWISRRIRPLPNFWLVWTMKFP